METFTACVDKMLAADIHQMRDKGYQFFLDNYTVGHIYEKIVRRVDNL